jgi:hypothetical protein
MGVAMTDVAHAKPPAPLVTRVIQLFGLAALVFGGMILFDARDCEELACLAGPIGIAIMVWGAVALLSGLRGPAGMVFLIGAIVLGLAFTWVKAFYGLIGLLILSMLMTASKDRLAPYYRRLPKPEAP